MTHMFVLPPHVFTPHFSSNETRRERVPAPLR